MPSLVPAPLQRLRVARRARARRGTTAAAGDHTRDNIAHHYDLSNDLFGVFLDPSLSYSSALFADDPSSVGDADLERRPAPQDRAAPRRGRRRRGHPGARDRHRVGRAGDPRGAPGRDRALDHALGRAAARLAQDRVAAAGVADRVDVELCDYRERHRQLRRRGLGGDDRGGRLANTGAPTSRPSTGCWRPGGRAADPGDHDAPRPDAGHPGHHTWINKYIFPGGFLPSVRAIDEITRGHTTLRLSRPAGVRGSTTPRRCGCGTRRSSRRRPRCARLGFDETFQRMWHFYLEYSRAGFASGYLDVQQLTFVKDGGLSRARS